MKARTLLKARIRGQISTNSNREAIGKWREELERTLASLQFPTIERRRICIKIEFWIYSQRLQIRRNDLDNLVKPVLDAMKRISIFEDDADIFQLEATKFPTEGDEEVLISVREWN